MDRPPNVNDHKSYIAQRNPLLHWIILLTLACIFLLGVAVPAHGYGAAATGSISGIVWIDANDNRMQEVDEEPVADAVVYVRSADGNALWSTQLTIHGAYVFHELPYGYYWVWSEGADGSVSAEQFVEINEIHGGTVDIPLEPARPTKSLEQFLFLPLINR